MRSVHASASFVSISGFKAQAADWLRRVGESGTPVIITQNGKPAGVLLSPSAFDELTERACFVSAVNEGLADAEAGRVHRHADVVKRMKARFSRK